VAFDLDTYKRSADRLDLDGIDLDAFRDQPLAPEHLRCLRYMHDVENHTSCYLRNLLNTRAHHDPEITTFLTLWNHEEFWHGEALGRVLAEHDSPAAQRTTRRIRPAGRRPPGPRRPRADGRRAAALPLTPVRSAGRAARWRRR
jgi:hypothetical protein